MNITPALLSSHIHVIRFVISLCMYVPLNNSRYDVPLHIPHRMPDILHIHIIYKRKSLPIFHVILFITKKNSLRCKSAWFSYSQKCSGCRMWIWLLKGMEKLKFPWFFFLSFFILFFLFIFCGNFARCLLKNEWFSASFGYLIQTNIIHVFYVVALAWIISWG